MLYRHLARSLVWLFTVLSIVRERKVSTYSLITEPLTRLPLDMERQHSRERILRRRDCCECRLRGQTRTWTHATARSASRPWADCFARNTHLMSLPPKFRSGLRYSGERPLPAPPGKRAKLHRIVKQTFPPPAGPIVIERQARPSTSGRRWVLRAALYVSSTRLGSH